MEVSDKNIFKNSMNYEFKIGTREKKSNLPLLPRSEVVSSLMFKKNCFNYPKYRLIST